MFLTLDRGKSWRRLKANLPTVRIDEMVIHPRDNALILGTHGRALWVLDHLEPIQEFAAAQAAATADAQLFSVPTGVQFRMKDNQNEEFWGHQFFLGENPPADAVIQFHLKKTVTELRLKITDATGREIRESGGAGQPQSGRHSDRVLGHAASADRRRRLARPPSADRAAARRPAVVAVAAVAGQAGRGGPALADLAAASPGFRRRCPSRAVDPVNPCGGGGGGGGFGGGGGARRPARLPGHLQRLARRWRQGARHQADAGRRGSVDQMTDVQAKRYFDAVAELHEMQRRGGEMAAALNPLYTQMVDLGPKVKGMANVPDAGKAQFEAVNKEFDAVRVKFGVPAPAAPAGGGGGRGGGGVWRRRRAGQPERSRRPCRHGQDADDVFPGHAKRHARQAVQRREAGDAARDRPKRMRC